MKRDHRSADPSGAGRRPFRDVASAAPLAPAATRPGEHGLVGVDGLDAVPSGPPLGPRPSDRPLRLSEAAAERIREEIDRAGGREVCFLAAVTDDRIVVEPRAVARGNREAVLAVARDAPEGALMIHNHPSGSLEPSDADLGVAGRCWEEGLGTAITDNGASALYVVVEPPEPREIEPLDVDALEAVVAPGGRLEALHPGYEDRTGQREMLRLVAERFNDGGIAIVEAGTGTGKSLAYLLPAARWAVQNGERTVVSTATINLQEQLVGKDLPLVDRLEEGELTWAMVKGRGNYVSIRRARLAAESAPTLFETDRSREIEALLAWIDATDDGSLSDLPELPSDELWEEVRSDPDVCLRSRCPHFQQCFYQRSRRRAAQARLVVVNHHLLFTDLAVRRVTDNYTQAAVLPAYGRVVLDEAHNLEDAATSHMGVEVTRSALFRALARLDRKGKGLLTTIHDGLAGAGPEGTRVRSRLEERVRPALEEARSAAEGFVDRMEPLVPAEGGEAVRIGGDHGIDEPVADDGVRERLDRILGALGRLERELAEVRRRVELVEETGERMEGWLLDLQGVERRVAAHQYALRLVLTPDEDQARSYVRWLEVRGRGRRANLALAAAPIDLGPTLRESLFEKVETAVLCSATLATRRSFDFLRDRIGLSTAAVDRSDPPLDVTSAIVPSPFDFGRQTLLVVPTDLPDVRTGDAELQRETARVVAELATLTDGGVFALFTSHRALRRVAEHLREGWLDARWPLLVHGEDHRVRLLDRFVRAENAVLLGTASFWEGVDVPGDPLRGLVIQKLPFRVPTEPVTAARVEAIERGGGNAFWEFMLPLAALRLKQGFGRLVRSREDRGAVILLDDRIVRRRYGAYLRDSLPPAPFVKGAWSDVRRALDRFYAGIDDAGAL